MDCKNIKDNLEMKTADKIRTPLEKYLLEHAIEIASSGIDVVLENGFWNKKERDYYLSEIKNAKIKVELFYLKASFTVLKKKSN